MTLAYSITTSGPWKPPAAGPCFATHFHHPGTGIRMPARGPRTKPRAGCAAPSSASAPRGDCDPIAATAPGSSNAALAPASTLCRTWPSVSTTAPHTSTNDSCASSTAPTAASKIPTPGKTTCNCATRGISDVGHAAAAPTPGGFNISPLLPNATSPLIRPCMGAPERPVDKAVRTAGTTGHLSTARGLLRKLFMSTRAANSPRPTWFETTQIAVTHQKNQLVHRKQHPLLLLLFK